MMNNGQIRNADHSCTYLECLPLASGVRYHSVTGRSLVAVFDVERLLALGLFLRRPHLGLLLAAPQVKLVRFARLGKYTSSLQEIARDFFDSRACTTCCCSCCGPLTSLDL